MWSIPRCGLAALTILLAVVALREGDDEAATSLLQVEVSAKPLTLNIKTSFVARDPDSMLSTGQLLHIPYNHIAVNLTYKNLGEEILTFPQRRPREFNVILATCKTTMADAIVQFAERRRGHQWHTWKFDWRRSLSFALFGFLYIGITQWFLMVSVLTWLFPDAMVFANAPLVMKLKDQTGMIDMAGQVLVDNIIFEVLLYFPVFYVLKSVLQGTGSMASNAQTGLNKYWNNIVTDNLISCAVWVPCDVVIFACPMYLRMPLEHGVSFGWTMFISAMRGAAEKTEPKSVEA